MSQAASGGTHKSHPCGKPPSVRCRPRVSLAEKSECKGRIEASSHACAEYGCRIQYGVELQPGMVFETDSSSAAKFSRHLLIKLPGRAFASNHAVGSFVSGILAMPQVPF